MAVTLPKSIVAGDKFTVTVPNYDGRDCVVTLSNATANYSATATESEGSWVATFASSVTAAFSAGQYLCHIGLDDSGERETLQTGRIEVKPDPTAGNVDFRSHAERVLEAIELVLEGKASQDHEQMTVNGKAIKRFAPEQLLMWRDKYRAEVAKEKREERIRNGGVNTGIIRTRFS